MGLPASWSAPGACTTVAILPAQSLRMGGAGVEHDDCAIIRSSRGSDQSGPLPREHLSGRLNPSLSHSQERLANTRATWHATWRD
jgi:hypothetical protein